MVRLLNLLTLLVMVAHSVFGCCWHHAHGADCQAGALADAEPGGAKEVGEARHCCGHCHHRPQSESGPGDETPDAPAEPGEGGDSCPHDHGGCDEETCKYLGSPQPKLSAADVEVPFDALPPAARLTSAALFACRNGYSGHVPPLFAGGGRCVRDLTQIWLL